MGLIGLASLIAVFMWMNSHRAHREHREIIMLSALSARAVANNIHLKTDKAHKTYKARS